MIVSHSQPTERQNSVPVDAAHVTLFVYSNRGG